MLSEINKSVKVIPSTLDFYDIAGLVKVSARQLAPVPRTDAKSLDGIKRLFGVGGGTSRRERHDHYPRRVADR